MPPSTADRSFSTVLAAGILVGSSVTLLAVAAINRYSNSYRHRRRERGGQDDGGGAGSTKWDRGVPSMPDDLREEQLSRHTLYFGEDGMRKLSESRVVVVGLGGVGSHTAHMLARAGIGHLRMVDFDQVTLSSLNRHAVATLQDVGTPKATCLHRYLERICPPNCVKLESMCEMYTAETGDRLLELQPPSSSSLSSSSDERNREWDIVIDAIDDVPTKAVLIADCLRRNVRVVSCMGAGGKSDFTRLHLSDLRTATRDPLASKLRQELRKHDVCVADDSYLDDMDQLSVLYSSEKTVVKLADFTDQQLEDGVHQYGAVDGMRIRVIPVLGTTPAIFGQALAAACLTTLGGKPFQPVTGERVGRNVRNKTFQHLKRREDLMTKRVLAEAGLDALPEDAGCEVNGKWIGPLAIDQDDVEYLLEIWRNRCAVTGARLGTTLNLVRWDEHRPGTCDNLVLMSAPAIQKFDDGGGKSNIPEKVRQRVEERLLTCRVDR